MCLSEGASARVGRERTFHRKSATRPTETLAVHQRVSRTHGGSFEDVHTRNDSRHRLRHAPQLSADHIKGCTM